MKQLALLACMIAALLTGCDQASAPAPANNQPDARVNPEALGAAAERVARQFTGEEGEPRFDRELIVQLDAQIEKAKAQEPADTFPRLSVLYGSVLGEALVRSHGGQWTYVPEADQWAVELDESRGGRVFPMTLALQQLQGENPQTLTEYFDSLGPVAAEEASQPEPAADDSAAAPADDEPAPAASESAAPAPATPQAPEAMPAETQSNPAP